MLRIAGGMGLFAYCTDREDADADDADADADADDVHCRKSILRRKSPNEHSGAGTSPPTHGSGKPRAGSSVRHPCPAREPAVLPAGRPPAMRALQPQIEEAREPEGPAPRVRGRRRRRPRVRRGRPGLARVALRLRRAARRVVEPLDAADGRPRRGGRRRGFSAAGAEAAAARDARGGERVVVVEGAYERRRRAADEGARVRPTRFVARDRDRRGRMGVEARGALRTRRGRRFGALAWLRGDGGGVEQGGGERPGVDCWTGLGLARRARAAVRRRRTRVWAGGREGGVVSVSGGLFRAPGGVGRPRKSVEQGGERRGGRHPASWPLRSGAPRHEVDGLGAGRRRREEMRVDGGHVEDEVRVRRGR